jgi:GT2 family glycosyltransferase
MQTLLFTTSNMKGERSAQLLRLLGSLASEHPQPLHYVLLQGVDGADAALVRKTASPRTRVFRTPARVTLSRARNQLMFVAASEHAFDETGIVGFPDDDAFYPQGLLPCLRQLFSEKPDLDLFVCKNSMQPETRVDIGRLRLARTRDLVRFSSSNTMFLRSELLRRLGNFDESLGLGTPTHGGEDTEYVLRASLLARRACAIDRALVCHPDATGETSRRYFAGSMIAIARHARRRPSITYEFARKIMVGLYHVTTGDIQRRTLQTAIVASMGALNQAQASGDRSPKEFSSPIELVIE